MSKKHEVARRIWSVLGPSLHSFGFSRISGVQAFRDRHSERTIDIVKLEFFDGRTHRSWGTTNHSFGISLGVYLSFAPNPFGGHIAVSPRGEAEPDVSLCALRSHLLRVLPQPANVPENVWSLAMDLSNIDAVAEDASRVVQATAQQWFGRFSSLSAVVDVLENAEELMAGASPCFGFGRKGSPVRNLYLGFAMLAQGNRQGAHRVLNQAMEKGGFSKLSGDGDIDRRIREQIAQIEESHDALRCGGTSPVPSTGPTRNR